MTISNLNEVYETAYWKKLVTYIQSKVKGAIEDQIKEAEMINWSSGTTKKPSSTMVEQILDATSNLNNNMTGTTADEFDEYAKVIEQA